MIILLLSLFSSALRSFLFQREDLASRKETDGNVSNDRLISSSENTESDTEKVAREDDNFVLNSSGVSPGFYT